jgi:putative transposase
MWRVNATGSRKPTTDGRGDCYDNSRVETFFKTIKSELIWPVAWQSRQQAENADAR